MTSPAPSPRRDDHLAPRWIALSIALAGLASSTGAQAQSSAERVATAQALYESGTALLRAGEWAEACAKLEASQRLDPALGTQFFLAECYESSGRPTSAWSLYQDVADAAKAAGNPLREATAHARAAALEPRLPRVTVTVPEALASIPGLQVHRDEIALAPVVWGTAVPVDFGEHVVRATAPGRTPWQAAVRVGELGQRVVVAVPFLPEAASVARPATTPPARIAPVMIAPAIDDARPASGRAIAPQEPGPAPAGLPAQRVAALVVGGVGVAGLAAGGALGLLARSSWSEADAACPAHAACSQDAHDRSARAVSLARGSTIAFSSGGAVTATALVLWLTARSPSAATGVRLAPLAGAGVAGVVATGAF